MAERIYDFAVLGSTPLACLLAGLLADSHSKKVALVGRPPSPFQPPRGFDLSVAPVTRPATWTLLKRVTPEVLKLLGSIDRLLVRHIQPHLVAETPTAMDALSHMRHVAAGYGYPIEQLAGRTAMYRFREAALIDRRHFGAQALGWCAGLGVTVIDPDEATVGFAPGGNGTLTIGDAVSEASHTILADDEAVIAHLGCTKPEWLVATPATAVMTEPLPGLPGSMVIHADSGVVVGERPGGGAVAIAPGSRGEAHERIAAALAVPARIAGEAGFATVAPEDGGPFVGSVGLPGTTVIAGFGLHGAFLAPAIARYLTGSAGTDEHIYFAARGGGAERSAAAEWSPPISLDAVA